MILKNLVNISLGLLCSLPFQAFSMKRPNIRKSTGSTSQSSQKNENLRKSTSSIKRPLIEDNKDLKFIYETLTEKGNISDKTIRLRRRKLAVFGIFNFPSPIEIREGKKNNTTKTKKEWIKQVLELNQINT